MSDGQASPVALLKSRMKLLRKFLKLACQLALPWSVMFAKPNWLMPMTAYMNIRRSRSIPRLPIAGRASLSVLKMI